MLPTVIAVTLALAAGASARPSGFPHPVRDYGDSAAASALATLADLSGTATDVSTSTANSTAPATATATDVAAATVTDAPSATDSAAAAQSTDTA
ncbi:hypothetical protein FA95DRAFT_1613037, partial [Auriscalpium vulgare]